MTDGQFCRLTILLLALAAVAASQVPKKVTYCELKQNPAAYNHDLVEVTGFVSHGFEDFTGFEPSCPDPDWTEIWLEYGGETASGTMYCCGLTNARTRPKPMVVEDVPVPLVQDRVFNEFDQLIQRRPSSMVHGTVVGRYFSGRKMTYGNEASWGGYGHMGCCSLLVIQQVLSVDQQDRNDLDYDNDPDQPDTQKVGCGFRILTGLRPYRELIENQKQAEQGQRPWAFDDARRTAAEALARLTKASEESLGQMQLTKTVQGRMVYTWKSRNGKPLYMAVVSRPSWMAYYSRDPNKVAWGVMAAYEIGCGRGQQVRRLK